MDMIDPTKLLRGAVLALAIVVAAPFAGIGGALFGATAVQAQNPVVATVLFEGNKRFTDAQLLSMIDTSTNGGYTTASVDRDVESIRLAYDDAGYQNVQVTARVEPIDAGRARVTFVIVEGDRSGITAINFTGNEHISSRTLESILTTKRSNILSWLFRDDIYTVEGLERDKELIRIYYGDHGYPDTQVTAVAEFDESRNGYFINFTIVEGDIYEFGTIGIETSIDGLNADALRRTILTREGARYSFKDMLHTTEDMALAATGQGYPFADVRPRIDRDVANHVFNITYLVDDGPRIYVERIDIIGNEKTRDFVIRREFEFAEGDPFNRSMVSRGKTNIEALGFFKQVDVNVTPGSAPDRAVITVSVVEQSTGDYGATVGYSSQDGILGEVSLTERNFLGRGQYLKISVGASQSGRTFDLSFTEPRFMGLKIATGFDVYHRIEDESVVNFYGLTTTGGQLRAGLPLTRAITANVFAGVERKLVEDDGVLQADGVTIQAANDSNIVDHGQEFMKAWVGIGLTYNRLDDMKHPTQGLYATFSTQYVGWDHNYLKSEARARYYIPMFQDIGIIASIRGAAGVIQNFNPAGLNALESFSMLPTLVRGFQPRGAGPRLTTGEYLGSTMYAGISGEIEFPIPVIPETYGIRGAIWGDAAVISGVPTFQAAGVLDPGSTDNNLKASVGVSLIWDGPFGPLRGDVAYVVSKATLDRTQVFQLSIQNFL
jgi:outer membrane protein insertion porin family